MRDLVGNSYSLVKAKDTNFDCAQLDPYFRRIKFTPEQKRTWFSDRQGVLFGFAFGWSLILKSPFMGPLFYGVAEAATAYLITKITDPPPPPSHSHGFSETQVTWKNKHEFLHLSLENLDKLNIAERFAEHDPTAYAAEYPVRKFA